MSSELVRASYAFGHYHDGFEDSIELCRAQIKSSCIHNSCWMPNRPSSISHFPMAYSWLRTAGVQVSPSVSPTNSIHRTGQVKASTFVAIGRLVIFLAGAASGCFLAVVVIGPKNECSDARGGRDYRKQATYFRLPLIPYEETSTFSVHHDFNDPSTEMVAPPSDQKGWKSIHVFVGNSSHIEDASEIPSEFYHSNEDYHARSLNRTDKLEPTTAHSKNQQRQWFAQLKQDLIVATLYRRKRNGYFVDLAANDAVRISNT
jgi:hypothetical protein